VYYIQYAHARVSSVMKQADARGFEYDRTRASRIRRCSSEKNEQALLKFSHTYPERWSGRSNRAPHAHAHYLREPGQHLPYVLQRGAIHRPRPNCVTLDWHWLRLPNKSFRNGLTFLGVHIPETIVMAIFPARSA